MRQAEGVLEIPRYLIINVFKLGVGLLLLTVSFKLLRGYAELWPLGAPVAITGLLLVASNTILLVRRAPVLRATRAGLWFGGGSTIPWRDITTISDATLPGASHGARSLPQINIAFCQRSVVLALPWWLWFNTYLLCRIAISIYSAERHTATVLAILEGLRTEAHSDGPDRAEGASDLPPARILRR